MQPKAKQNLILWSLVALTALLSACTDSRLKSPTINYTGTNTTQSTLFSVADVKFQNQNTIAQQMFVYGTSLYMTGRPFGFTRWEISPDAENPVKTFAISDNINTFSPSGAWTPDFYAANALTVIGQTAFMSGMYGLSLVSLASTNIPVEVARKPPYSGSGSLPSDEAYQYQAIVHNPSKSLYYGFRQQDYVYTVDTSNVSLNLVRKESYGANGQSVCCVKSAAMYSNRIYVAFGNKLVMFDMAADGKLVPAGSYEQLHASNVVATQRYLYVQHEPITGVPTTYPAGIYVFDSSGNNVDRINTGVKLLRFAVSSTDAHLYANVDNTSVKIYRIQWLSNKSY